MEQKVKKRVLLYVALAAVFLGAIPSVAFRAGTASAGSSSGYETHYLGEGATIESIRELLADSNHHTPTVTATGVDGAPRTSGPIREGDLVEIFDAQGDLVNAFLNVRSSADPAAEPPSSQGGGESSRDASSSSGAPSEESDPPREESGSGASGGSPSGGFPAGSGGYYVFGGSVTVAGLEEELSESGTSGSVLTVASASGAVRESGPVCTGDVLTVQNGDGSLQSRFTAVIPGDLTRCGSVTSEGCRALYDDLTGRAALRGDVLRAADLNGDGKLTTSDLLELKKMLAEAG